MIEDRAARYRELRRAYEQAKEDGKTVKIWRTAGDEKVRDSHAAMEGVAVGIDENFEVEGEALFLPSDPDASLDETANCRCTVGYVAETSVQESSSRRPVSAHGEGRDTVIVYSDGSEEVRRGGTRAWRNNNPGNLRNSPFSQAQGSLGEAGGFAVFPSEADGEAALLSLLRTGTYQALTLNEAIARYAPVSENDTLNYQSFIQDIVGAPGETPMNQLSAEQIRRMADAIRRMEGWREGQILRRR